MVREDKQKRYLVIKHGALGDFIMATGAFAAIRRRHPKSHITLLTTPPFAELAKQSPYFDDVWVDIRPSFLQPKEFKAMILRLRKGGFKMVYDLQTSGRTNLYFRLMGVRKPLWSGIIEWCSHPHKTKHRTSLHTIDRLREQLFFAFVTNVPNPDILWMKSDISRFNLPKHYAIIVPGGSAHRPEKRWTVEGFSKLARFLKEEGITPVLIGTKAESGILDSIAKMCQGCINLCDQTSFEDVASLARSAQIAVGNDTGPMHILAVAGAPALVLFSRASNPKLCAPRGKQVRIIEEINLKDLSHKEVISVVKDVLALDTTPSSL